MSAFQEYRLNYSPPPTSGRIFLVFMTHRKLQKMTNDSEGKRQGTKNSKNHIKLQTKILHNEICGNICQ